MRRILTRASRRLAFATALAGGIGGLAAGPLHAEEEPPSPPPSVVASIAPVHSLVAGVMAGVGEPTLLVKGGASPHTYTMKPSDAAALSGAQVVFRVAPGLETFLDDPLKTLASQADVVDLSEAPGLRLLPLREGGVWEPHDHGHAGGEDHGEDHDHAAAEAEHDHDHDEEHAAATPAADADHARGTDGASTAAESHDDHGHGAEAHDDGAHDAHAHAGDRDMHLWLDPRNAAAMTREIVATLSDADPANADRYARNGAALEARLAALDEALATALAPVRDRPFIVFHDAYQYLDARYGLDAVGAITLHPDRAPGAARIQEIRALLAERGAVCVFTEPQFEPRVVSRLVEDTGVRTGVLDPDAAAAHPPGPDLYFALMEDLSASLVTCLGGAN
jgi:zinc transport system substrate-binding protein